MNSMCPTLCTSLTGPDKAGAVTFARGKLLSTCTSCPTKSRAISMPPAIVDWIRLLSLARAQVQQHDDEEEQHHDRPRVDENLDDADKERVQRNEEHRQRDEGDHEAQRARHRVGLRDRPRRRKSASRRRKSKKAADSWGAGGLQHVGPGGKGAAYFLSFHLWTSPGLEAAESRRSLSLSWTISSRVTPVMAYCFCRKMAGSGQTSSHNPQ